MSFPIQEVGIAGVVAMFAIDKFYSLAKNRSNKGEAKKCIDHASTRQAVQNNALMAATMIRVEVLMQKLVESNVEQVVLLKGINGKK